MTTVVKMTLSARAAAQALGISERTLWALTKAGKVLHVKIGSRTLYPTRALEAWLADQADGMTKRKDLVLSEESRRR